MNKEDEYLVNLYTSKYPSGSVFLNVIGNRLVLVRSVDFQNEVVWIEYQHVSGDGGGSISQMSVFEESYPIKIS